MHIKQIEKEEQKNPKVRRKEIIKIRPEINEKGNQKIPRNNDNENMMTQNLWDAAKAVLTGKFIAIQSYLKKQKNLI